MHDLRRSHPRKDATGAAGLRRQRVAVRRTRKRRVPAAAKRARFRPDALRGVAGIGVPDPSQAQGNPSPSRQPGRPTLQATAGKLRLARAAPQARTGLRGGSPPGGHRPSRPPALRNLPRTPTQLPHPPALAPPTPLAPPPAVGSGQSPSAGSASSPSSDSAGMTCGSMSWTYRPPRSHDAPAAMRQATIAKSNASSRPDANGPDMRLGKNERPV